MTIDTIYLYKFTLVTSLVDTTKTWNTKIDYSDRVDYDDENRLIYEVTEIGVDSTGFFFKWVEYYYGYDAYGVLTRYTRDSGTQYLSLISGEYIITFKKKNGTDPDDVYQPMFSQLPAPTLTINQPHIDIDSSGLSYSTDGFGITYLKLDLFTEDGYEFDDDVIDAVYHVIGQPDFEDVNYHLTVVSQTTTECVFRIELYVTGVGTFDTCAMTELIVNTLSVIKNPLSVEHSYVGCSGSFVGNTISYGNDYTNVLTADSGYSLDEVTIHVYLDGVETSDYSYDSATHTITIENVTQDVTVTVSAQKLNTFRFYSSDGNTLYAEYIGNHISSMRLTLNGSQRTLIINGVNTFTWTVAIPQGYRLLGFSETVNSTRYDIPIDIRYTNPIRESKNYYETIVQSEIIPTTFRLTIYQNASEKIRVDKSDWLTFIANLDGTLRDVTRITTPTIRIEYSGLPNFNYVYIPQFQRYYFVNEIISVNKDIWDIGLSEDVLMSFRDEIRSQYAFVERNQYTFDVMVEDTKRTYEKEPEYEYVELENSIFDVEQSGTNLSGVDKGLRFVVTVIGKE